jgi:hypothetical protein
MYKGYGNVEWILDSKGQFTSTTNPGKTKPKFNPDYSVKNVKVYIHPSAFGTITTNKQFLVVGHEMLHVLHIMSGAYVRWAREYQSWDKAEAITEYNAYLWQVDNENRLGYPIGGQIGLDKWTPLLPAGYLKR